MDLLTDDYGVARFLFRFLFHHLVIQRIIFKIRML
jgi:hypothetical protein